jgi:hypothetical protein
VGLNQLYLDYVHTLESHLRSTPFNFDFVKEEILDFQLRHNAIFKWYKDNLRSLSKFPFLPISAFKSHVVSTQSSGHLGYFESSGTTNQNQSKHFYNSLDVYHEVSKRIFEENFGPLKEKVILALLPNYLEKSNSSLVNMVKMLMDESSNHDIGFYLYNYDEFALKIQELGQQGKEVIVFGVSFALLDCIDIVGEIEAAHVTIIETGGMKGRKKEIIREELHEMISSGFINARISSEYGMTELFSQAYLQEDGWFKPGYTMQVFTTEINDPLTMERFGKTGVINVIDLANIESCSFITTEDLGILREDGCFKVLGRLDNSDMRGCNLMVQ